MIYIVHNLHITAGNKHVVTSHVIYYMYHLVRLVLGVVTRQKPQINGSVVLGADESPWPCGTPSWYTPLSWMILSEQKNLHLFLTQHICVFSKMSVCPSVDRIVSALYLQEYSSAPSHICTSHQATSKGVSRVMPISKFRNLKFGQIF